MDLLDEILDTLALKGVMYFRTDFNSDWSVTVPDLEGAARFHLVVQGECHVRFESGETIVLGPGDLVLIPRGRSHILSDKPVDAAPSLEQVLQEKDVDIEEFFCTRLEQTISQSRCNSAVVVALHSCDLPIPLYLSC